MRGRTIELFLPCGLHRHHKLPNVLFGHQDSIVFFYHVSWVVSRQLGLDVACATKQKSYISARDLARTLLKTRV